MRATLGKQDDLIELDLTFTLQTPNLEEFNEELNRIRIINGITA